mgnify:CR=1 FL=1
MRATGVMSFQENGIPVWSGVVKMFDRVMTMVCGVALLALDVEKALGARPSGLVHHDDGTRESLCFSAMPAIRRAIWSAPPPVPAGTTNSMGLVGSQAACAYRGRRGQTARTAASPRPRKRRH